MVAAEGVAVCFPVVVIAAGGALYGRVEDGQAVEAVAVGPEVAAAALAVSAAEVVVVAVRAEAGNTALIVYLFSSYKLVSLHLEQHSLYSLFNNFAI